MTNLYFIRHGQSVGNLHDLFLGHTDMDLTDLGRSQAERVPDYFEKIAVDTIYSSDLLRAYHTACPLAKAKGIQIIRDESLREIWAGEWEGRVFSEIRATYPMGDVWWNDTGLARPDGGESVAELQERICNAVSRIARENEGKTVCIFTHFTPIYALRTSWEKLPLSQMKTVPKPTNASITHALYEKGEFAKLLEYAEASHLRELFAENRA